MPTAKLIPLVGCLTGAAALRIGVAPVAVRRAPAAAMIDDDACDIITLDAAASTVFGKHYMTEAVICGDNAEMAASGHECHNVMYDGELVWACSMDQAEDIDFASLAAERDAALEMKVKATASDNDTIFDKFQKALENFKMPAFDSVFSMTGDRVQ